MIVMRFDAWVRKQPRGTLKRLERDAGVGYMTLMRAMRGDLIATYAVAKRISDATGGAVSIDELCEAEEPTPRRAAGAR